MTTDIALYYKANSNISTEGLFASVDIPEGTVIVKEKHAIVNRTANFIFNKDLGFDNKVNKLMHSHRISGVDGEELSLLTALLQNLDKINKEYGPEWIDNIYSPSIPSSLKQEDRKALCILAVHFKPTGGFKFIHKLFDIIKYNYFQSSHQSGHGNYVVLDLIAAKFNHACNRNCEYTILPNHIIVTANKNIKKGEELTVYYGPDWFSEKVLRCNCGHCNEGQVTVNDYSQLTNKLILAERNPGSSVRIFQDMNVKDYIKLKKYKFWFSGIEIWYPLFSLIQCRLVNSRNESRSSLRLLFHLYVCDMIDKLAVYYDVDKKDILTFFVLSTQQGLEYMRITPGYKE